MERIAQFGQGHALVGIETPTASNLAGREQPTFVFLNAGIVYRVGPHRLTVTLARRIADTGFPALRFDLSGAGDSPPRSGVSYQEAALADIRDAMDYLEHATHAKKFVLCGLCSGADNSVRAALLDKRVVGLALLAPYSYRTPGFYLRRSLRQTASVSSWRTLARQAKRRLLQSLEQRLCAVDIGQSEQDRSPPAFEFGRPAPTREVFAAELGSLLDRGAKILVVYPASENYIYAEQFDDAFPDLGRRVAVEYMPEANHTFTEGTHQRRLAEALVAWSERAFPAALARAENPPPAVT